MTDTSAVTIHIDTATKDRINALRIHGFTLTGFVRAAIDQHLARLEPTLITDPEHLARIVSRA